jgi:IclR family transcriptional regulator, pca regulon regulatory protein
MTDPFLLNAPPLQRRDWIAGLEKGLTLLQAFDETRPRLTASQAGQRCGMTRTVARRLLLTLTHLGFVASDGKLYWLTPRVLRLGQSYLQSSRLPRAVQPFLQRVTSSTGETAYLAVLDGGEVVYIARNGPQQAMSTGYVLGARTPARLTAAGQVLLAGHDDSAIDGWLAGVELTPRTPFTLTSKRRLRQALVQIREQGWALSEQQLAPGQRGIAVPLLDLQGVVVGALSVTLPMGGESGTEALSRVLPALQATARAARHVL